MIGSFVASTIWSVTKKGKADSFSKPMGKYPEAAGGTGTEWFVAGVAAAFSGLDCVGLTVSAAAVADLDPKPAGTARTFWALTAAASCSGDICGGTDRTMANNAVAMTPPIASCKNARLFSAALVFAWRMRLVFYHNSKLRICSSRHPSEILSS